MPPTHRKPVAASLAGARLSDPLAVLEASDVGTLPEMATTVEGVVDAMVKSLSVSALQTCTQFLRQLRDSEQLSYGSDCTCLDSPWVALKLLEESLRAHADIDATWVREFASEDPGRGGDPPPQVDAIERNAKSAF